MWPTAIPPAQISTSIRYVVDMQISLSKGSAPFGTVPQKVLFLKVKVLQLTEGVSK